MDGSPIPDGEEGRVGRGQWSRLDKLDALAFGLTVFANCASEDLGLALLCEDGQGRAQEREGQVMERCSAATSASQKRR